MTEDMYCSYEVKPTKILYNMSNLSAFGLAIMSLELTFLNQFVYLQIKRFACTAVKKKTDVMASSIKWSSNSSRSHDLIMAQIPQQKKKFFRRLCAGSPCLRGASEGSSLASHSSFLSPQIISSHVPGLWSLWGLLCLSQPCKTRGQPQPPVLRNICLRTEALLRHRSAASLRLWSSKGWRMAKALFLGGSLDMLVQTLCSLMNILFSTGAGRNLLLGENVVSIAVSFYCVAAYRGPKKKQTFRNAKRCWITVVNFTMPICLISLFFLSYWMNSLLW